jgi:hypothetical protein
LLSEKRGKKTVRADLAISFYAMESDSQAFFNEPVRGSFCPIFEVREFKHNNALSNALE